MMNQSKKIIAIHEAAHAAICLDQKITFEKVTIIPKEISLVKLLYQKKLFQILFQMNY